MKILVKLPQLPQELRVLQCYCNHLITLPSLPKRLRVLNCFMNSLKTLPALPHTLQYLDCQWNRLSSAPIISVRVQPYGWNSHNIEAYGNIISNNMGFYSGLFSALFVRWAEDAAAAGASCDGLF